MIDSYPKVDFLEKLIVFSKSKPVLPQILGKPTKPSEPIFNSEGIGCGSNIFTGIALCCTMIFVISLFAGPPVFIFFCRCWSIFNYIFV